MSVVLTLDDDHARPRTNTQAEIARVIHAGQPL
jgi:hypothetical protein